MAVDIQRAYKAGKCSECGGTIRVNSEFVWGQKARERVHVHCSQSDVQVETVAAPREIPKRIYSAEQRAVIDEIVTGRGSLVVEALAGTGKTYTIEGACMELPETVRARYMVFNRKNANEAKEKLAPYSNVEASTFHSAGYAALRFRLSLGRDCMDDRKVARILGDLVSSGWVSEVESDAFGPDVIRLVHFAKCAGIGAGLMPDIEESWYRQIEHFGLQFDMPEGEEWDTGVDVEDRAIEIARRVLTLNNEQLDTLDYDDQIYQAVRLHVPFPKFDIVFVDEAQDTNATRRAMIHMMVKPGGRVIAVGDRHQAIMGFTGADSDSLDLIRSDFNAKTMPLTVNFRCSKGVIRVAQEWVPEIKFHSEAPDGAVEYLEAFNVRDFTATDAALCRTNAPLVTLWYKCFKAGVPAQVLGRDLGRGIIALVKKLQGKRKSPITIDMLIDRAEAYREREIQKWTSKGDESKAQAAADKVDCLLIAIDTLPETDRTLTGLMNHLNSFANAGVDVKDGQESKDLPPVLTLSTIHKSKGLEWDRVFVLNWGDMPSKWARKEWEKEQESNLQYVAITRAKKVLHFIDEANITA